MHGKACHRDRQARIIPKDDLPEPTPLCPQSRNGRHTPMPTRLLGAIVAHYPRVGRRGAVMAVCASLWAWIGLLIIINGARTIPGVPHTYLPVWVRVSFWLLPAAVAAVFVFRRYDTWGWIALSVPATERAVSYVWGWVLHIIPGGDPGYERGLTAAVLYIHMAALCIVIAGWREPMPIPPPDESDNHLESV